MPEEDYYTLLGVGRNATEEDIKRAYRRLARELHPDTNTGTPDDAKVERFKLVNRAYRDAEGPRSPAAVRHVRR